MRVSPWMRVAISAVVVAIILWRVPAQALFSALENMDSQWLFPALATSLASLAVRAFKWQRLLQAAGSRANSRDITRSLFCGFALGVVTPGRMGEFGRCLFVPESERAPIIPLNILDRVLDSWSVVTYAVASLVISSHRPAGIFGAAIWLAVLPVILGLPRLLSAIGEASWWGEKYRAQFRAARPHLGAVRVAPFAAWAMVSTSFDILTFFCLLRAFHPATLATALATYPWIVMASGIPLSLGGLGLREGAAALLLAHYAIPAAVAADVALFLFAFLSLLPGMMGGVMLLRARREKFERTSPLKASGLRANLPNRFRMSEE